MDAALDSYGLAAVCLVIFLKSAGIPIPVPGDLLLLATAAQAASGRLLAWEAFVALLVAAVLGGMLQFVLVRGSGRRLTYRLGRYVGLTAERLETAAGAVRRAGLVGIALFVLTPGVRTLAIPACAVALVPWRTFVPGLVLGSTVDLAMHFALGFAGGRLLSSLVPPTSVPWLLAGMVIVLAVVGLAGWWWLRRRRGRRHAQPAEVLQAWEQSACPACLALGAGLAPDGLASAGPGRLVADSR